MAAGDHACVIYGGDGDERAAVLAPRSRDGRPAGAIRLQTARPRRGAGLVDARGGRTDHHERRPWGALGSSTWATVAIKVAKSARPCTKSDYLRPKRPTHGQCRR